MPPKGGGNARGKQTATSSTTSSQQQQRSLPERSPSPVVTPDVSSDIPPILFDSPAEFELVLSRLSACIEDHLAEVLELETESVRDPIRREVKKVCVLSVVYDYSLRCTKGSPGS
jgi:hypothetical protein